MIAAAPGVRRRRPPRPTTQAFTLPAPVAGINTVAPAGALGPGEALAIENMASDSYGLRSRFGYQEWATNLGYSTRAAWAANTAYTAGTSYVVSCGALYVCSTSGTSVGSGAVWAASTVYAAADAVYNAGRYYVCATGGTSDSSGGPLGTGLGIVDNTVTWDYIGEGGPHGTGTAISDGSAAWDYVTNAIAVRTVIPFTGAQTAQDRLFAATTDGIYDCTSSSNAPTRVLAFTSSTDKSGRGTSTVFVNSSGNHYCLYFDEENGYHIYDSSVDTWYTGSSYGTPVSGADPTKLVQGCVWGNRLWCVERDTAKAWYTSTGAFTGAMTGFVFGGRFRSGGQLAGLYNWTIDGGSGVTNSLVAISSGGDVVIYQGTDPSYAATFALKGVWSLGGVPVGRRIASDYGGDLLILSNVGAIPLSRLIQGGATGSEQYETRKIGNLFAQLASTYRLTQGWSVTIHPEDNTLIITVPSGGVDTASEQLVMSLHTKGWSRYSDLPIVSCAAWQGKLYFGTADGRVCVNTEFADGVTLAGVAHTNYISGSEVFIAATWTLTASSLSSNSATAPDGTSTADKLIENSASAIHKVAQSVPGLVLTLADATTYTFSVYAKASTRSQISLNVVGLSATALFDLSAVTATLTAGTDAAIESVGNSWYRCSLTYVTTSASQFSHEIRLASSGNVTYTGDGTSGLFIWGAQVEEGDEADYYVRTFGLIPNTVMVHGEDATPIQWSFLTGFSNLGSPRQKRGALAVPSIVAQGPVSYSVAARWNYDMSEISTVAAADTGSNLWDSSVWDTATWGDFSTIRNPRGLTGCGVDLAIAMRGTALVRTTVAGVDVHFEQGGVL